MNANTNQHRRPAQEPMVTTHEGTRITYTELARRQNATINAQNATMQNLATEVAKLTSTFSATPHYNKGQPERRWFPDDDAARWQAS